MIFFIFFFSPFLMFIIYVKPEGVVFGEANQTSAAVYHIISIMWFFRRGYIKMWTEL